MHRQNGLARNAKNRNPLLVCVDDTVYVWSRFVDLRVQGPLGRGLRALRPIDDLSLKVHRYDHLGGRMTQTHMRSGFNEHPICTSNTRSPGPCSSQVRNNATPDWTERPPLLELLDLPPS